MLEKLNEAWRRMFPHRNPKTWSDETLVTTNVVEQELEMMLERTQQEMQKLNDRIRRLESHRSRSDAA